MRESRTIEATVLPQLPPDIRQFVFPAWLLSDAKGTSSDEMKEAAIYYPMLLGHARIGYRDTKYDLQENREIYLFTPIQEHVLMIDWSISSTLDCSFELLETQLPDGAICARLPESARLSKNYTIWKRELIDWLYRNQPLRIYRNAILNLFSEPDESKEAFADRIQAQMTDAAVLALQSLQQNHTLKKQNLEERIRKAEQSVQREKQQARNQIVQTIISIGAAVMSALIGKKMVSATTLGRATTAARGVSRTVREQGDVGRTKENVVHLKRQLDELEQKYSLEHAAVTQRYQAKPDQLEPHNLNPMKKDIMIRALVILWYPLPGIQGSKDAVR